MAEVDEAGRRVTMKAQGRDKRGPGSANATIHSAVSEAGGVTTVGVETDFTLTGRLAHFGRGGMIEDVSNRLLRDFAICLETRIAAPSPAQGDGDAALPAPARPIRGIRLLLSVLWERIRRFFRRLLGR